MERTIDGWDGQSRPIHVLVDDCGCKWTADGKTRLTSCAACLGEAAREHAAREADGAQAGDSAQVGDVVFLFRQDDDADLDGAPPLLMQHAVMAALRQAGLLPAKDPERDARDIAEFKERSRMARPQVRRYGRGGWNR